MARQKGTETHIEVTKGFATEINPVISTPEVLIDVDNCILSRDGTIRRRKGVDFEDGFSINQVDAAPVELGELNTFAFTTGLWTSVDNIGTLNIVVQQVGTVLQFYSQFGSLSSNNLGDLDLADFAVNLSSMIITPMQIASGLGKLFVVSPFMEPVVITFNDGAFEAEETLIQIRDFTGLDDELATDERPSSLSVEHHYNLLNQGWNEENITIFKQDGIDYPSNSDIMTVGIVVNKDGDLEFDPKFIREDYLGNTPAPRGHFILDAFNKNYLAVSGLNIETVTTNKRPEAIAFHQGRVFYSAPSTAEDDSGFFYSQQLLKLDRRGLCFQEADPTAAEINDLIATDGGFIPTPALGQVYKMQEMSNGVVNFASNGVWYLTGAEVGSAVTATSLRLDKIYSSGVLGAASVVEGEGAIYFFGEEGIMRVAISVEGGTVENISKSSIQSFYTSIDTLARSEAVAVFIPTQRKVFWGYMNDPSSGYIDRFLILDLDVGGYYKYSITTDDAQTYPRVVGMSKVAPLALNVESSTVITIDGSLLTELDGTTLITSSETLDSSQVAELKLATVAETGTSGEFGLTFSTFDNVSLRDWNTASNSGNGLPMVATIDFAQTALGAVHLKAKPTWVHTYYTKFARDLATLIPTGGAFGCSTNVDLVLLLDVSGSLTGSGFLISDHIPGVQAMVAAMLTDMPGVNIAIDGFSGTEFDEFRTEHFQDFTSDASVLNQAIEDAYLSDLAGSATPLAEGIVLAGQTLAAHAAEGRAKVVLIVTDGVGNVPAQNALVLAEDAAIELSLTADIYVAGIGTGRDGFNDFYLKHYIARTPEYYFDLENYDDANEMINIVSCPPTQSHGIDYLGGAPFVGIWEDTAISIIEEPTRVLWIEDFGLYVQVLEHDAYDVVGRSTILTSPDGITWTIANDELPLKENNEQIGGYNDIAYSPSLGLAVLVGDDKTFGEGFPDQFATSTDGITWTVRQPPVRGFYEGVMWSAEKALFIASGREGLSTSTDGINWTVRNTSSFTRVEYSPSLGLFVALRYKSPDTFTSTDGIVWTLRASVLGTGDWHDIAWSPTAEIFVAVHDKNFVAETMAYSTDGLTWSHPTFTQSNQQGRHSVRWFPTLGKFIAVSPRNSWNIISSPDGITWTKETGLTDWIIAVRLNDIAMKSATEYVLISQSNPSSFSSNADPF